ncbi:DUF6436 domain-containing protein [Halopseudomonas salina]|uniref:DUF6436 domain-containing protein n=1 Tax=Halopseudomonas salina TaxID=1323744 RepID=A0ABQ1P7T9_9GAMM|nr:DUF6436 domain-containing protein [Halopseudomonas salina]GGC92328.1 hypothetical protein GCM10007418_09880 [Halopseudomonas salina]
MSRQESRYSSTKKMAVGLLLLGWFAGLAWAFWWFEGQYVKAFERPVYFSAQNVQPPFAPGQVQVLHVWQPGCPCNGGHEDYLESMTERFSELGVMFARAGSQSTEGLLPALKQLPHWPIPSEWNDWPGAPSVAIWDAAGNLAYVGPYSDGAHCSRDSSFIEPVITTLLAGRPVNIVTQDTVACLCDLKRGI